MIEWLLIILILLLSGYLYYLQRNKPKSIPISVSSTLPEYTVPYLPKSFPEATAELRILGVSESVIQENEPIIQENLKHLL